MKILTLVFGSRRRRRLDTRRSSRSLSLSLRASCNDASFIYNNHQMVIVIESYLSEFLR